MMRSFSPLWSCDFWISHAEPWRKIPTDLHKWDTFPTQVLVLVLRCMCRQWAGLAWRCLWRWTENVWKMRIGRNRWNQNQIQPWFFWWGREVNQSTKQYQAIWIMNLGIWIMEPFVISSFSTSLQEPPAMCLARCHMHHPEHLGPKIC